MGDPFAHEDEDGRAYVDCVDNGVGMGEAELRGVFSHAGSRFAEQPDFLRERDEWERQDPPIRLYPNSRFGIGVLSYFMLADEIRVTTCRMHADGTLGPELEAIIHGPGHLFRIVRTGRECRAPGTSVRLYLKNRFGSMLPWSCVDALGKVLGIAEFDTIASGGKRMIRWKSGVPNFEGLRFSGAPGKAQKTLIWEDAPPGVDVVWCEKSGGLLVDGLVVEMPWGEFPPQPLGLVGAVVNLSGPLSPKRLSVDRTAVISDVSGMILELLECAVDAFTGVTETLWNDEWFLNVKRGNEALGDSLASYSIREGSGSHDGRRRLCLGRNGYVPLDAALVGLDNGPDRNTLVRHVERSKFSASVEAGTCPGRSCFASMESDSTAISYAHP